MRTISDIRSMNSSRDSILTTQAYTGDLCRRTLRCEGLWNISQRTKVIEIRLENSVFES
jgi:hypothetical protein